MSPRDRAVERAAAEAERLYRAAVRRYRRAVPVVCNARVARAAKSLAEAGAMVEQAMRRLARPVYRRLGLIDKRDPSSLCHMLHVVGVLARDADEVGPRLLKDLPRKLPRQASLDKWLVRDGRLVLDAFARAGRLDLESEEGRRLQALIRTNFEHLLPDWPAIVRARLRPRRGAKR